MDIDKTKVKTSVVKYNIYVLNEVIDDIYNFRFFLIENDRYRLPYD